MKNIFELLLNEFVWPKDYLESAKNLAKEYKIFPAFNNLEFKLKRLRESKKCKCRCY